MASEDFQHDTLHYGVASRDVKSVRRRLCILLAGVGVSGVVIVAYGWFRQYRIGQAVVAVERKNGAVSVAGSVLAGPTSITFSMPGVPRELDDNALRELEKALLQFRALRKLDLAGNNLTDASVDPILKCKQLVEVDVSFTKLTPVGLAKLGRLSSLQRIVVSRDMLTTEEEANLQVQMRHTTIRVVHQEE